MKPVFKSSETLGTRPFKIQEGKKDKNKFVFFSFFFFKLLRGYGAILFVLLCPKKRSFVEVRKKVQVCFCFFLLFLGYLDRRMKTTDQTRNDKNSPCCFVLLNVFELNVRTKKKKEFFLVKQNCRRQSR